MALRTERSCCPVQDAWAYDMFDEMTDRILQMDTVKTSYAYSG